MKDYYKIAKRFNYNTERMARNDAISVLLEQIIKDCGKLNDKLEIVVYLASMLADVKHELRIEHETLDTLFKFDQYNWQLPDGKELSAWQYDEEDEYEDNRR